MLPFVVVNFLASKLVSDVSGGSELTFGSERWKHKLDALKATRESNRCSETVLNDFWKLNVTLDFVSRSSFSFRDGWREGAGTKTD